MASTKLQTNLLGKTVLVQKPQQQVGDEVLIAIRAERMQRSAAGESDRDIDDYVRRIWPTYEAEVVCVYLSFDMVKFVVQDEAGKLHDGIGVEKVEVVG